MILKYLGFIILLFVLMIFIYPSEKTEKKPDPVKSGEVGIAKKTKNQDYDKLPVALAYLKENIPEIAWVEFDDNNVYIGWRKIPSDFSMVNRAAAMIGNRAIDFGVHVWSVEARQKNWRPGDGPYYCETTARYRKVQDSNCK